MHSKTELAIVLALLAIPFVFLWQAVGDGPTNPMMLAMPAIGIFGIWLFLRYPWWLKLALSIVYFAAFALVDISYSVDAGCEQMAAQGRSCI